MSFASHFRALIAPLRQRAAMAILAHRVRARHPTLRAHPTSIWDYGFHDIDALEIGRDVTVGAFAFILVYRHAQHSSVPGKLIVGDRAAIGLGTNVRAAGGTIRIGEGSGIAQYNVLVAANHTVAPGEPRFHVPWDEDRTGIDIGKNVWIGAGCVILPGTVIGDNAVIAAGSVVRGDVPAEELWGGVPARKIKRIDAD